MKCSPAQVVASVREGLAEDHRGRWKNLANNQAEAFLSAESQLIKFVLLLSFLSLFIFNYYCLWIGL